MSEITSYCSWCFENTEHIKVEQNFLSRNIHRCTSCDNGTVECRYCSHMAKGTPGAATLKSIEEAREMDEKESKVLGAIGKASSAFAKIDQSWNNELCAEHDGSIASFKTLSLPLDDISDYKLLFVREQMNLAKPAKHVSYAGVGIAGAALIVGTGGGLAQLPLLLGIWEY